MTTILKTASALAIAAATLTLIVTGAADAKGGRPGGNVTHSPKGPPASRFVGIHKHPGVGGNQVSTFTGIHKKPGFGTQASNFTGIHKHPGQNGAPAGRFPGIHKHPGHGQTTSGGGSVISCHPNTGCTITPPTTTSSNGSGHMGWPRHDWSRHEWSRHDHWRAYGVAASYEPAVVAAADETDACVPEYTWRNRFLRGIGFKRVRVKACAVGVAN